MRDDLEQLYREPGHLIRRLQQIAVAVFMAETRGFDLTPVQYAALVTIGACPGVGQIGLANLIAFDRSTIADVVERLESKKLIRRNPGGRDRRTKLLHITPAGRRLVKAAAPSLAAIRRALLSPLRPGEREVFMTLLGRMVDINNERSRAPQRLADEAPRTAKSA